MIVIVSDIKLEIICTEIRKKVISILLYIIPTYECNLNCKSCYAQKYKDVYKECLTWGKFVGIYNKFSDTVDRVAFIGGEAIKWKFIDEAILFLKNKNIKVSLFSNGIEIPKVMPDHVILNASDFLFGVHSEIIAHNIDRYKSQRVKVTLRFNIDNNFENHIIKAISISKRYADFVSISPLFPVKYHDMLIGNSIYMLAKELINNKIRPRVSRAIPLCLFTEQQRIYLEKNCNLRGVCSLPTSSLVINPDGISTQPCVELPIVKKINTLSAQEIKEKYRSEIDILRNKVSYECVRCYFYKEKKCFGGCLAYK